MNCKLEVSFLINYFTLNSFTHQFCNIYVVQLFINNFIYKFNENSPETMDSS